MTDWHPDIPTEYRNRIVTGDAKVLAERLPDGSVDLIFTDPPYPREYLPLYEWVSHEGSRILKQGRYLFAYGGSEFLPEYMSTMGKPLDYFWTFILLHNGAYPRMWHKQLMNGYKPVLVYTNGKPAHKDWISTVHTPSMDKRYHEWGQGIGFAIKIIDMLTESGDVVFDPFVGGGTTAAACKMLGRNYIAFEVDPDTADLARERVANTQPPLFVPEPQQAELAIFSGASTDTAILGKNTGYAGE